MDEGNTLGQRLRARRRALSLTQSELASRAGVSQSTVVRTEKDETVPDGATLLAFARELGVTIPFLVAGHTDHADNADLSLPERSVRGPGEGSDELAPGEMPETLGQRRDYARQEIAAKKELARRDESVEEWVWPHVRAANNFTLANTPPSVAMLVELAKFIAAHGDPSVRPRR
jgi:transcriptional regulator with XRE-family HTH domain